MVLLHGLNGAIPGTWYKHPHIQLVGYRNKWDKFYLLVKYSILLFLIKPNLGKKLLKHLASHQSQRSKINFFIKAAPIVWFKPEIFHLQWVKWIDYWSFVTDFDIRLVVSLRGAQINWAPLGNVQLQNIYKEHFKKVHGFHAVSHAIKKEAQKYGAMSDKIFTIYSGLDLDVLDRYKKDKYDFHTPFKILLVGRFHWKKGYHLALDALYNMKKNGIKFRCQIIAGQPTEEFIFQTYDLDIESDIEVLPQVPMDIVLKIMQDADLLILPSLEEGIANVVLEAMALGLPVLSADCGGMPELIRHGENGWLFKTLSAEDLIEKLELIMQSTPTEREHLAECARKDMEQNHRLEHMVSQMIQLYLSCA